MFMGKTLDSHSASVSTQVCKWVPDKGNVVGNPVMEKVHVKPAFEPSGS